MTKTDSISQLNERQIFLFLLWEASREKEKEILEDIGQHFTVLKQYEVSWPQENWVKHLEAFYGHFSQVWIAKARSNGTGNFRVVIVEDPNPIYDYRDNLRGATENVNINIYNAKKRYRTLIKSKDKVHSSVNLPETRHNLAILLNMSLKDFLQNVRHDGAVEYLITSPPSVKGWENLSHLFYILNETVQYVVMRNFESLLDPNQDISQGDIDIMVSSRDLFAAVTGARKTSSKPYHFGYLLQVGKSVVRLDLREPGDGYYDPALAKDMIVNGRITDGGIRVPSKEDHFYSLLYHALIHKPEVPPKYYPFFEQNAASVGINDYAARFAQERDAYLKALVSEWLIRKGYSYCRHLGSKAGFNTNHIADKPGVIVLKKSYTHICLADIGLSRFKLHLLTGVAMPNIFRIQIRLGGIFKIDLCLGDVKEIGI
jgi:hypothetical protein